MTTPGLPRVAVIGLGNMGEPMARNLLRKGFPTTVWNRTASRADALVRDGATRATSVAEAAGADVVLTMVSDDAALEGVAAGGLFDRLRPGAVHVSMSTVSVALVDRLAAEHAGRHQGFVSAPVFGRPDLAGAARLFVVAAGAPDALDRCRAVFEAIGQRTFSFGDVPSAANVVKVSGNFLITSVIESLGEAFALVRKSGVEPAAFLNMLTDTIFGAPVYKTYGTLIAEGHHRAAGFRLRLGLKDVSLALDIGKAREVPLPVASLVRDHMIAGLAQGLEDADWSVLGELAAARAGLGRAGRSDV